MNTEVKTAEPAQTPEDKFFGVKTSIDDMLPTKGDKSKDDDKPEIILEDDDEGEAVRQATPSTDDDVEKYSDKVQKRIDKLTWQRNEERRGREASEAVKNEAIRAAQVLNQKSQNYENIIATGEANLVEQIKGRALLAISNAKSSYRDAYESGDTEAIISAQEALTIAQAEQLEAFRYEGDYHNRLQNWQQQQQFRQQPRFQAPQPQQQQRPRQPTPESQSWTQKNPWFGKNEYRDMTAVAYAEHEKLIRDDGVKPDTDEYYNRIDTKVRNLFPDYFRNKAPPTVVAPGNRNNGAKPRTVRLKPSEVAVAKALGLTVEEYAKQLLKENR